MTIQDALERAKKLGRERAESNRLTRDDTRPTPVVREAEPALPEVPMHYPALGRVELDLPTCGKNNILVTDAHVNAAGAAGAAYRLMRGRILHRIKGGNWSCIGFTSAGPGDGKTITTLNLAISIAREKLRKVYLFDLDMRRPSVWNRCGRIPAGQLSQYLSGDLTAEDVLYETSVDNLVIAGNHDPVSGASELLASTRLDELLRYVRRRSPGALVLLDLPPALSTDEAIVVAPRTDALFLVVSEGLTRRDGLSRAIEMLSDFTIAGVILNRSTAVLGSEYYGY